MKEHGGNIYAKAQKNGVAPETIIDFSASINPLGMPRTARAAIQKQMRLVPHYPEPYAESLCSAIAKHYHVPCDSVISGNGSTELIFLLPRVLKPKRVLLTAPAFSEYEKAVGVSGAAMNFYTLTRENNFSVDPNEFIGAMQGNGKRSACDMAFLCNPNNPTGRLLRKRDVLKIADAARELECTLVVDEAFIDFCSAESVVHSVARNPFLIVLRSLTKFYALAGLRLGFGVFPGAIVDEFKAHKEPWSVNSLASAAGRAALSDGKYEQSTLALIKGEKQYLEKRFRDLDIFYVASAANYYLLYLKNAATIIGQLEKKGLLIRDCSNFNGLGPGYVRVAVRSRKENSLLMRELEKLSRALPARGCAGGRKRFLAIVKNEASRVSSSGRSRC